MAKYGFFPQPGTNYTFGEEPELARRLNRLAKAIHLHLLGISGYRTPAHSVAVGGFPNDPHTRGQASDTPGIESVPETTLRRYGLTRPFPGAREADHIQLLGGARGNTTARPRGRRAGPADWLSEAGWRPNRIPLMVAIGGAESGWKVDAVGGPNSNGTYDYGWLQINSSHGYDKARLLSDPVYTARAGKAIYNSQGPGAWSTYNNGAYKSFLGKAPTGATFGRTRPGGEVPGEGGPDTVLASFWGDINPLNPTLPDPLQLFKDAGKAINGVGDFLKWVAWIFHPLNILRAVEFMVGFPLILAGIAVLIKAWLEGHAETPMRAFGTAFSATPPGRALRATRGRRLGRSRARERSRKQETQRAMREGDRTETQRQGQRRLRRESNRDRRRGEEIPF